jgi:hypothetical protein
MLEMKTSINQITQWIVLLADNIKQKKEYRDGGQDLGDIVYK